MNESATRAKAWVADFFVLLRQIQFVMKRALFLVIVAFLMVACTGRHATSQHEPQPSDTLYTAEAAMEIYDQDPNQALVIIDSALLVGNIDEDLATMLRAKVYCHSNMEQHLDTARQLRSIREKNAVLTKEITDKIENEEKYLASIRNTDNRTSDSEILDSDGDLSTLSDSELFDQLRRIILEERLFLDPQFGRQQLMDRLHLSKESIGAAFSKGSQYASLASFVNEMRLIHGAKLLSEHPEMSISDVATASGFGSNITFSHNFKERYALTPTEFRSKN